jgi:DNA-binding response OmpR family regulator
MDVKILLIDGDRWMQRVVISALQDQDYRITTASDGFGGLALALADPPSLIISDIRAAHRPTLSRAGRACYPRAGDLHIT